MKTNAIKIIAGILLIFTVTTAQAIMYLKGAPSAGATVSIPVDDMSTTTDEENLGINR